MDAQKRKRFWQIHGILALWICLPLFVMFWAGSFALFEPELNPWLFPNLKTGHLESSELQQSVDNFCSEVTDPHLVFADLTSPETRGVAALVIDHEDNSTQWWINPENGDITPAEDDSFSHFLLDLHYFAFIPNGTVISGFLSTFFGVVILTGVIYQWRTWRRDLRAPKTSARPASWHRWLVAISSPFQILYALTGGLFGIGLLLLAPILMIHYNGEQEALVVEVDPSLGFKSEYLEGPWNIATSYEDAQKRWKENDSEPEFIRIHSEPAPEGTAVTYFSNVSAPGFARREFLTYSSHGEIIHQATARDNGASLAVSINGDLHFATYADFWSKTVHFWLALIVALSMTTGVAIWIRRKKNHPTLLSRLLQNLCITVFSGLPLATAVGFVVAPFSTSSAIPAFSIVWALTLIVSFGSPRSKLNPLLLRLTGLTFLLAIISRLFLPFSASAYIITPLISALILAALFIFIGTIIREKPEEAKTGQ